MGVVHSPIGQKEVMKMGESRACYWSRYANKYRWEIYKMVEENGLEKQIN